MSLRCSYANLTGGFFRDALCYDSVGATFTIFDVQANPKPTLMERFLPWRTISASLTLSPSPSRSFAEVRAMLVSILEGESEMADGLQVQPSTAIARICQATTPSSLIAVAREIAS